jgi:micrococcal nuclease
MSRSLLPALVAVAVVVAGALVSADVRRQLGVAGGTSDDEPGEVRTGEVLRVVDGDTIRVRVAGREERVRYIGVDTPESAREGAPAECFARRAAAENARLVDGRRVRLEPDAEARDRFGRLLAYVFRAEDGRMVNESLVRGGFAVPLSIPPNDRYAERFEHAAGEARGSGRGLWGACQRE